MQTRFLVLLLAGCLVLGWMELVIAQPSYSGDQVQIEDVSVLMSKVAPVILLKVQKWVVPIFVDPTVANSVDGALRGIKPFRPLSHNLMHTILQAFGGKVVEVRIKLEGQIYYGELAIDVDGDRKIFDSRSSDAVALAIHFKAPIYVGKELLDQANRKNLGHSNAKIL